MDQYRDSRTAARAVTCILASLVAWTASLQADPQPGRQPLAITDVTVIDVERGRSIGPRTVLIDEGRIVTIATVRSADIPANAQRIDGRGRFLIPGLVDMHVHLFNGYSRRPPNDWSFPLFIANGVTAVREMNADTASIAVVNQWRKAVEAGDLIAPRILAAGVAVRGKSPDDAVRQVNAAADAGTDFIKIFSEVPVAHWRAILDSAQARSLPVLGHVPAGVSLLASAAAGQRDNEHLMQAFEACSSAEAQMLEQRHDLDGNAAAALRDAQEAAVLQAFDQRICRRVAKSLAATGQVQVPTLVLDYEDSIRRPGYLNDDARLRYLRADERARWDRFVASVASGDHALEKQRWNVARQIVSTFNRSAVPILSGTDAPMPGVYPGFSLHDELALLVQSGLTPRAALRSATLSPAEFLGIAGETGSIEVGKRADLVVLDADPTRDVRNTRRIHALIFDGRLLRRADLDDLFEAAAKAQAP